MAHAPLERHCHGGGSRPMRSRNLSDLSLHRTLGMPPATLVFMGELESLSATRTLAGLVIMTLDVPLWGTSLM